MGVNGIYGLSGSGLDVESMVKVGMLSKQSQYDKMQQKYTKNEWTKAAYVEMYGKIQTFNNSTLSQYKMSANMNARTAESSNSEVKVTANASAPQMTHYVEVGKAATNAYLIGTSSVERLGDSKTSTQLKDAMITDVSKSGDGKTIYYKDADGTQQQANSTDVAFKFAVSDGKSGTVTSSDSDVATVNASASAKAGSYELNITEVAQGASIKSKAMSNSDVQNFAFSSITQNDDGSYTFKNTSPNETVQSTTVAAADLADKTAIQFSISDGKGGSVDISYSYQDVLDGKATLENMASKINSGNSNITASYTNGVFSLSNSEVGSENKIVITTSANQSGNNVGTNSVRVLNELSLRNSLTGGDAIGFTSNKTFDDIAAGTDAKGTVDGNELTFSGNTAKADGITYTATGVGDSTIKVAEQKVVSVTYGQLADGYTFNDLTAAVNNLGTNVKASYDSVNDKFSFYNLESGAENNVTISMADEDDGGAAAAKFFNAIGLKQSANGELADNALSFSAGQSDTVSGTNANVKVDGVDYDIADNKLVVNGVTYNFTGATEGTKSTVTITQDTDAIIDKVKSFVEDYNKLLQTLTDAYNEKPNSNYKPLTDSQRDNMKDEQIEKWEEKAKAGLLYHDKTLGKLISEMREAVSTPVDGINGKYNSIFALGISTTGTKGQLTLDETKLKAALADDADSVYNVFAKLDTNDMDNASKSGIAQRLGDVFTNNMKSIKSVSGTDLNTNDDSDLSKLLRELQTKMSNFKAMMNAFEEKLYKKYDAMETALASLGTQLNYVTSAFA